MKKNPCQKCGACCASFRVSFYWAESDEFTNGGVPANLTEKMDEFRLFMIGTNGPSPRCIALDGEIGGRTHCRIYENRSSACRAFEASWENNAPISRCDKARRAWGLDPLTAESWLEPTITLTEHRTSNVEH